MPKPGLLQHGAGQTRGSHQWWKSRENMCGFPLNYPPNMVTWKLGPLWKTWLHLQRPLGSFHVRLKKANGAPKCWRKLEAWAMGRVAAHGSEPVAKPLGFETSMNGAYPLSYQRENPVPMDISHSFSTTLGSEPGCTRMHCACSFVGANQGTWPSPTGRSDIG